MNDQARAELRELQARAFGRGGDIHDDPAALRRLEELQAQIARTQGVRVARTYPLGAAPAHAETEPGPRVEGDIDAGVGVGAGAEGADRGETGEGAAGGTAGEAAADPADEEDERAPRSRRRTWMVWLWIGSVLVAAGIAATWNLASAAFTLIAGDSGVRQIEVIGIDSSFEGWIAVGPPEGQTGFDDFYGMTPVVSDGAMWGGDPDGACLIIGRTADVESNSETITGPLYSGCSAGPFAATIQFVVTPDFPAEFLERFPEGEPMQLVLKGDRVAVFTAAD